MSKYLLCCADCGHQTTEDRYYVGCPACSGLLEVKFVAPPSEPVDHRFTSIFKYHRLMPYDPVNEAVATYEEFPDTKIFLAERLSESLGVEVYCKDETAMPSGTWKDREGFVSIQRLLKNNITDLVIFSSGNTATSLARSAAMIKGPCVHIVMPASSRPRIESYRQYFDSDYVKLYFLEGGNDECIAGAGQLARERKFQVEGGFRNYARREGLKLFALEVVLGWGEKVDWYVQPVAGGIGIYSFHKAYRDLGIEEQCPKMLGVQADICAPMVNAWRAGAVGLEQLHIPRQVIASDFVRVLRTRKPQDSYPVLKKIMDGVGGQFEAVSDKQILEGLRRFYADSYYQTVYRTTGKLVGLEPATALAGVLKGVASGYIARGQKVLLNVSGAAKDGDVKTSWLSDLL
jgi:threonine synthase